MVKLTRILKNEYRDDVDKSKRGRRSSSRNKRHSREPSTREAQEPPAHDGTEERREDITKLPPALLKILQAHAPGYHRQADADREEREQAESMTHNSTDNPHHSALIRAAQMALSADGIDDQSTDPSTMALIDSIVQTSDDPALIEALQAMMGDASGHSHQQRETLALVAESIMEKKAAKEALKRAVLAESRLHESLKKCAPELSSDTATFVATEVDACVSGDANSTPIPLVSNHAHTSPGFFNRINKSLTNSSQSAQRRLQLVKPRTQKNDKTRRTSKSKSKSSRSVPSDDIVVLDQSGTGDVEHPSDEPVFLMSTQPFPSTKEDKQVFVNEEVTEVKEKEEDKIVGETRDDQEVSRTGRSLLNYAAVADDTGTTPSKRRNKYRYIANIEPDLSQRHARSTCTYWKTRSVAENQSAHGETVAQSTYVNSVGQSTDAKPEEQHETTVANGSDVSPSAEEDDGSDSVSDEENGDEVVKVEYKAEGEALAKIEYTIFELESKLSMSSGESSVASPFSAESSETGDNDDDEEDVATDSDTLDDVEENAGEHEEDVAVSDFGEEEEDKDDDESDTESDDDNSLLFASFCQRPETSIDNEEVNDEDDDENSHDQRHRRRDGRRREGEGGRGHREVDSGETRSLLACVSGYFGVADGVDEKKTRRRRRSKRRAHRRHRI
jgi:hypothetical protein